jgi:LTXXQ motif family protein
MKTLIISTIAAAAFVTSTWAQAPDPHHPEGAAPGAAQPAQPAPQGPSGMGGMADMMRMMQGMRMIGPGMSGMGMIDHVEGRVAFLRAELKITDAQANAWNSFADALRANAQKLAAVRPAMMPAPGAQQTLTAGLEAQERWLTARLEGLRAIKAAFTPLYGALSDEQKKTATELLGPHLGLAMTPGSMMPSSMMSGPMQSGQQMGPGQMGPGRMAPR